MKRIIPFLISLVTLASCTGMLDDMQSQIDDLDSRVTALEKDSKLISENLSTVKKDLEAGLSAIVALQKSTAEIADTLAAHKARLQNDMEVSFNLIQSNAESISNLCNNQYRIQNDLEASSKLIQTALDNIKTMSATDSELAQSIVEAYAAINTVLNLCKSNSSNLSTTVSSLKNVDDNLKSQIIDLQSRINLFSNRLTTLESTIASICDNYAHSHSTTIGEREVRYTEKNYKGYTLYEKRYELNHSYYYSEWFYTPGKVEHQRITHCYSRTSYVTGPLNGPCRYVSKHYADGYDKCAYSFELDDCYICAGSAVYSGITNSSYLSDSYVIEDINLGISMWFIDYRASRPNQIQILVDGKVVGSNLSLTDSQSSLIEWFLKSQIIPEDIIASGFSLIDFYKSWNTFVDSVDFLDDSFKVSI